MITFLYVILIIMLAVGLEMVYEKISGVDRIYKADDTMEAMANSGVKTSLRLIGFGLLSIMIVVGLTQKFN
ncbi:hypothetical protein ACJJIE_14300 [Microbulbifer sp. TRSA001]|uniref:hypothetical protein n=1 Tax=Microbulbifer sp. TRSA001 TaxID=3243381 RepID=UPI00403A1A15